MCIWTSWFIVHKGDTLTHKIMLFPNNKMQSSAPRTVDSGRNNYNRVRSLARGVIQL